LAALARSYDHDVVARCIGQKVMLKYKRHAPEAHSTGVARELSDSNKRGEMILGS
jgi:hypothetical protein